MTREATMESVSRVIRERRDSIVERWAAGARRAASARGLEEPELVDVIPRYLDLLAEDSSEEERAELVEAHFAARLHEGFQLAEMLDELTMLGGAIGEEWAGERDPAQRPSPADVGRLFEEIRARTVALTELFARHMAGDEQAEKRHARLIDRAAVRARREPEMLARFLDESLDVVMEAMGVQTATILLHEPETGHLRAVASRGAANDLVEGYVTSPGAASFAGWIAAEASAAQADVESTELEVSEALRTSGIRSLLGVRMPPRARIAGVLYVGLTERRRFSARELRRLELLADRILLHVESAALQDELRSSVDALEIEKGMRERFVAMLAHDLRGPLSTAKMAAGLLAQYPAQLDVRRDLAIKIDTNLAETDRMVRDLLDANRIRAGQPLPLKLAECDLGALAQRVAAELSTVHGDHFVVSAPERVVGCWDEGELHRALWNLAINAEKYGAPGGVVTLSVRKQGDRALVSVHNLGKPLPPDTREGLFDAFVRLPDDLRRGWGLGLTLVRGCAEAHGGRVVVDSALETGTTFTIELPVDARAARATSDTALAPP